MNPAENQQRPKLLTWLCIGSAISGLFWIIMLLALIIFAIKGRVPAGLFPGLAVEYTQAGYLFISALVLLAFLGLAGVFMMWQLKKSGFYLYTTAKILVYFLPVVFIGYNHLTFIGLATTSIFIILFGTFFTGKSEI
jgi:hypothetical protein